MALPVDTKAAPHRELRFAAFDDILAEVERIEAGVIAGTATITGNWSVGEIGEHCAEFIAFACDGFPKKLPWPIRVIARAMILPTLDKDKPMPTGITLPKGAAYLLPTPGISDAEGIGELRKELKRVLAGREMTQPSPLLGPLTHEQWTRLQCKHCAMHLGFVRPDGTGDA
ncbi:MAG: DUF1569 domain-containing protein [Phycisphaeraceae bacterium]|nr:MAG: DUF1569 domain-containing protein [Phycisphaeraceae bacterium]